MFRLPHIAPHPSLSPLQREGYAGASFAAVSGCRHRASLIRPAGRGLGANVFLAAFRPSPRRPFSPPAKDKAQDEREPVSVAHRRSYRRRTEHCLA